MKRYLLTFVVLVLFAVCGIGAATAGTVEVPQTGQKSCYDMNGSGISCKGTGQDGDIQAGAPVPDLRFKDNGDGTMTDTLTGLMWLKDADCFDQFQDWKEAIDKVGQFNFDPSKFKCLEYTANYSDWVLPNANELESLATYDYFGYLPGLSLYLKKSGFIEVGGYYLSSTSFAEPAANSAFIFDVNSGTIAVGSVDIGFIWPVRGKSATVWKTGQVYSYKTNDDGDLQRGADWPSPRFTDNGDGTVTDNLTGLMWLKDADCLGAQKWTKAFDQLAIFNSVPGPYKCEEYTAQYTDWYLPNIKELGSVLDRRYWAPPLPSPGFTGINPFVNIRKTYYWSSTTVPHETENAFGITMNQGSMDGLQKKGEVTDIFVWPVRRKAPGETGNKLKLSPSYHYFGEITVSHISPVQTFTMQNISDKKVFISVAGMLPNDDDDDEEEEEEGMLPDDEEVNFNINTNTCNGKTLQPSEKCEIDVTYSPESEVKSEVRLVVETDAGQLAAHLGGEGTNFQTYTVTVKKTGPGKGEITGGSEISCGDTGNVCSETFPQGTGVFLSPYVAPGSVFESWSSACYNQGGSCLIESLEEDVTVIGTFGLDTGVDALPIVDIKANGEDTQLTVAEGTTVSVDVSLKPGSKLGEDADWWIWVETSAAGNFYYDVVSNQWHAGDGVSAQGPLLEFSGYKILELPLPKGIYTFYFVVDLAMNGLKDGWNETIFPDEVRVTVY